VELKHADITKALIGLFYQVYRTLGYGFLERVYDNGRKGSLSWIQ